MSAQIFSLVAAAAKSQPPAEWTKEEYKILDEVRANAISAGGVRNSEIGVRYGNATLILKCGDWDAAPEIHLSKIVKDTGEKAYFVYFREGGGTCSAESLEDVGDFAISDLKNFGAQTHTEIQKNAADLNAQGRRAKFRTIDGGRGCQPG